MSEFTSVCKVGSIPDGSGAAFTIHGTIVAVFCCDGEYFAIDDMCPHMGASLAEGHCDEDGEVTCPWHAWRFRVSDGTWCDNPRIKIGSYIVRIVGDDVQVAVPDPSGV